eukprot:CAMPEP_0113640260 /NCGR_PEP_ID=MMETSP0017_2-20120614/21127_1 /TAXON_ID=2856 /ORGANISM="Cylindrotheca closterium" /LENGTH=52 /DNA_ID=CAMNT_0000551527 /DNA_START=892 /DNA_END=1050 /DNA_ORIENTATION=+ /assembly_acc=CAM_ASM_000147
MTAHSELLYRQPLDRIIPNSVGISSHNRSITLSRHMIGPQDGMIVACEIVPE